MWRNPKATSVLRCAVQSSRANQRSYCALPPSPPAKSGGGGLFLKLFGVTSLGTTGVVGYAWYDKNFRKTIEDTVPYSSDAFSYIFSVLPADSTDKTASDMPSLAEKLPGFAKTKKADTNTEVGSSPSIFNSSHKDTKQKKNLSVEQPALLTTAQLEQKIQQENISSELENVALEKLASELMTSLTESTKAAKVRHIEAVEALNMHREQVKKAMKAGSLEELKEWDVVTDSLDHKKKMLREAESSAHLARQELEKLTRLLSESRDNAHTKKNPVLITAQESLNEHSYKLDSAATERNSAESSLNLMKDFKSLVDQGKKQFSKELESIVPDASVGKRGKKMSEDELNALIAHAHKRIEQLQIRMAEQEVLEEERLGKSLHRQREEDDLLTEEVVKRELEKQRGELAVEKQKWETDLFGQMEEQLRQQLSRQAAAHNDHLTDVLRVQRRELNLQYEEDLREELLKERIGFHHDISDSMSRLKGIETAVEARAKMERTGRKAQELWLACQTLVRSLQTTPDDHSSSTQEKGALANDVRAVKDAGNDHVFVNTIINSIPEESLINGVHTQGALTDRFRKVNRVCRRVAMIDETGGSLLRYFLSYIQSVFIFDSVKAISVVDDIDINTLGTFTILSQAERYLRDGDLEQAVRFLRQLRGQSSKIAADWLKDATLLLETQQAANALLGHASACGLGSLFSALCDEDDRN